MSVQVDKSREMVIEVDKLDVFACPNCHSQIVVRLRRTFWQRLFARKHKYYCRSCYHNFWYQGLGDAS